MGHFEKRKEKSSCFVRFFYQNKRFRLRRMKENLYPFFWYEIFTKHHTYLFKILVIVLRFEFERLAFSTAADSRLPFPEGGDFQFFDEQSEWNSVTCGATLYTELTLN